MVHLQGYDGRRAGDERVSMRKEERNKWNVQGYAGLCCSSLQAYSGISLNLYQTLMTIRIKWKKVISHRDDPTGKIFLAAQWLAIVIVVYNIIEGLVSVYLGFEDESLALVCNTASIEYSL